MKPFSAPIPIFAILLTACASATQEARSTPVAAHASPSIVHEASTCIPPFARREKAVVTTVTDGDSIEVNLGGNIFRVRYIGMDAPEMNGEPFAEEAAAANRELVEGKTVELIRDLSEADRYGRLLRFVVADGVFVNREMVARGLARAVEFRPDTACSAEFEAVQASAQAAYLGMWSFSRTAVLEGTGGTGCSGGCATPPAGCLIKGNINLAGEKIYHVPGGEYYAQTAIDPQTGEGWFCSEEDAVAAGWRRSKR